MVVVSTAATAAAANRVFYRVVAIDAHGTRSGCSDYAELPHPFIYSRPSATAKVGRTYTCQLKSLRSLGDYQCRQDPLVDQKRYAYRFWDGEQCTYEMISGPPWLTIEPTTGVLSGRPDSDDVGSAVVRVEATTQFGGRAEQEFRLTVSR
jgi:hypothetical protein